MCTVCVFVCVGRLYGLAETVIRARLQYRTAGRDGPGTACVNDVSPTFPLSPETNPSPHEGDPRAAINAPALHYGKSWGSDEDPEHTPARGRV